MLLAIVGENSYGHSSAGVEARQNYEGQYKDFFSNILMAIDIVNIALQDEIGHLTNRDMNKAEMLNASFASVFNILVFSIL